MARKIMVYTKEGILIPLLVNELTEEIMSILIPGLPNDIHFFVED